MIKRSRALLLAMLYIVTVFGFALNLHYCGNVLASVNIDSPAKSCKAISEAKMKCCKDKQVAVKVKDAHQSESPSFLKGLFAVELPKVHFSDYFLSAQQVLLEKLSDRGPPSSPLGKVATFIKNCIFRI
jgi:hypothetical protein